MGADRHCGDGVGLLRFAGVDLRHAAAGAFAQDVEVLPGLLFTGSAAVCGTDLGLGRLARRAAVLAIGI